MRVCVCGYVYVCAFVWICVSEYAFVCVDACICACARLCEANTVSLLRMRGRVSKEAEEHSNLTVYVWTANRDDTASDEVDRQTSRQTDKHTHGDLICEDMTVIAASVAS